jgi:hypothetical protein
MHNSTNAKDVMPHLKQIEENNKLHVFQKEGHPARSVANRVLMSSSGLLALP